MARTVELAVEAGGQRLDRFVADRCDDVTRSAAQRLIAGGHVTVDGKNVRGSTAVQVGQRITVEIPDPQPSHLEPQEIPLDVVYEDGDLVVISKPAGLTVHPGPGHPDRTLANAVLALLPRAGSTMPASERAGIVHRLDRDTSGLIVVAKNESAHTALADQFKDRSVKKTYLALVHGRPEPPEAVIDAPIGRHPSHRKRMAVVSRGRQSRTGYRTLERYTRFTLLELSPETGRTHQVRVHMASLGHPLAGDAVYGKAHPRLGRHFLHASMLGFRLPSSGEPVELTSPLPEHLASFLAELRPA